MTAEVDSPSWATDVFRVLKNQEIRQVATVPDGGLSRILTLCEQDPETSVVTLTTEEEGVALLCGSWLGGRRAVLMMQSSGVGNCINMLSLPLNCRIPCLMFVTMRGEWGEFNPWQVPMGQATPAVLERMGAHVHRPRSADEIAPTLAAASHQVFNTGASAAVLVGQHIVGSKSFVSQEAP